MARVRAHDTKPEMQLRRGLHRKGFRYRLHERSLPGRPDLVFRRARLVVFVHGCFWHQHPGCRSATAPTVNRKYWVPKLKRNVERDQENIAALTVAGYRVAVFWECEIAHNLDQLVEEVRILLAATSDQGIPKAVKQ